MKIISFNVKWRWRWNIKQDVPSLEDTNDEDEVGDDIIRLTCGELIFLNENSVCHSQLGEMILSLTTKTKYFIWKFYKYYLYFFTFHPLL